MTSRRDGTNQRRGGAGLGGGGGGPGPAGPARSRSRGSSALPVPRVQRAPGPGPAMAQRGGPAVLPDNPFQDPAVLQAGPSPVLDGYNPFESDAVSGGACPQTGPRVCVPPPPQASAAAATAELLKRQEELNRKAEELDRRERELQNAALGARLNNWPPLPSFCPVKPCFYQDIPVEIPADFQKTVTTMYYLWMASTIALFLNFLSSLAWFCVDTSSGSGFGLSILWALLYTPCSFVSPGGLWLCGMRWFHPELPLFSVNVMYVLQAIGIPNWGFSGWILSLIALRTNTAVAVMMILVSLSFTAVAVLGIIMLKKIHSLYRRTGASFQKAQEEFAAGVFSNQAVRTAAANAAAGAATNAFRAP
uniref:Secretory carrier-associated membrane protein n=1 Tax=Corvus moneduloides TaxID=1196302 RepID=A0A8U7P1C8_CORMO